MTLEGIFLCLQGKQKWPFWRNSGCFCSPSFHQCCNPQLSQPVDGTHPCGNATDVPLTSIWSLWSFLFLLFDVLFSMLCFLQYPNMHCFVTFLILCTPSVFWLNDRIKNKRSRSSHSSRSWQDVSEQKPTSKPLFVFTYFCCDAWGCIYMRPWFI